MTLTFNTHITVGLDSEKRFFGEKRQKDAKRGNNRHFTIT